MNEVKLPLMAGSFCLADAEIIPVMRCVTRPRRTRAKAAALELAATAQVPEAPAFHVRLLRGRLAVRPVRPKVVRLAWGLAVLLQAGGAEPAQAVLVDQALPAEEFFN